MKRILLTHIILLMVCTFGVSRVMGQTATFIKSLTVNATTKVELTDANNQPLKIGGLYRVKLSVASTGTRTGAEYLVWYDVPMATWAIRMVSAAGMGSNHPVMEVENNTVKVFTNHTSLYAVRVFAEFYDTNNGYVLPYLFGSSFQWQRRGTGLFYTDGSVGIGTDTPKERLSVKGKIQAEEIKVTTAAADWPDYVFKDDYKLPSLAETEEFIKTNGHLPDVPKAAVVENEGVSLGEMNKILLKKIEEMTLQLIQINNTMTKQAKQIDRQSKEIDSLKADLNK